VSASKPDARPIDHGRFGYARVSTRGQTLEVQLAALDEADVTATNVFAEKKSGRGEQSPSAVGGRALPATPW